LLIGVGPCLLHTQWPLSCRGSSLLGRGSWIDGRVSWPHGRKDWMPLHTRLGRCTQNVMLAVSMPNGISLPRRTHPVPAPNSLPTSTGHWRNAISFSACRWQTWRCMRRYWRRSWNAPCIPLMGEIYQRNWTRPVSSQMGSLMSRLLR
jgi:hypothetical protein